MIAFPFIFFFLSFLFSLQRKRGLCIHTYILILYLAISLCSIIVDIKDFYAYSCPKTELGVLAPFLYCSLLTLCFAPFTHLRENKIQAISTNIHKGLYDFIVYAYFIMFLIILFVSMSRISVILSSDLADIRNEQYRGETVSFYNHLSGLPRYICALSSILAPSSLIMLLFWGYNLVCGNRSFTFNLITLAGSLSTLLISINIADRSAFAYWIIAFGLVIVIFHRFFNKKAWRFIYIIGGIFISIMAIYFISVTVSRFGERDNGASGGAFIYAGQSYMNFCRFFNTLDHTHHSLNVVFPVISKYIFHANSYFVQSEIISLETGQTIPVFSTFIGFIMSMAGRLVAILYCIVYYFCAKFMTKRKYVNYIDLHSLIHIWIVAVVPVLGLFTYYYFSDNSIFALIIWLIMAKMLPRKSNKLNVTYRS